MPAPSTTQYPASFPAPSGTPPLTPRPRRTRPSVPDSGAESARSAAEDAADPAGEVLRWAVFSCLLVPVVLVVYGTSVAGAAVTALGLAAVTTGCLLLLRRSERVAARVREAEAESAAESAAAAARAAGDGETHGRMDAQGAHRGSRGEEDGAPGC